MKPIVRAMIMITVSAATAAYAQKASSLPQNLQQQQPPEQQNANQPTMTHVDPGQFTTESTKDVPQIDPGKIPTPGKHAGPSAVPEIPPAPTGPEVTGFQTPDHLLDDMQRGRLPGDQGRYEQSVRELFGDADAIRDLPGMAGSEVDTRDMLGGRSDGKLDEMLGESQGGHGLDEADFMPTPTTPRRGPENARGGPSRAPLGPAGPREAMDGADQQRGRRGRSTAPDGDEMLMSDFRGVRSNPYRPGVIAGSDRSLRLESRDGRTTQVNHYSGRSQIGYDRKLTATDGSIFITRRRGDETIDIVIQPDGSTTKYRNGEIVPLILDQDKGGIASTQDPYEGGDPALALWHYDNLYHGPKDSGIQDPNRGPPPGGEDGAAGAPPGTDFDLGDDIVINPDPAHAGGAGGGSLPRAIDQRSQIEQDHTPGGYTPEDRGGR